MDGDKSAKMLRENPRLQALGIILVSSCPEEQLKNLADRVGADAVVSKADARAHLVQVVARVLRAPHTHRPKPRA
jgi:CheY-like chemotaxis protein